MQSLQCYLEERDHLLYQIQAIAHHKAMLRQLKNVRVDSSRESPINTMSVRFRESPRAAAMNHLRNRQLKQSLP